MKHPVHVPRYHSHAVDLLQRKSKRRSALKSCLTLVAVVAALLCDHLALGMAVGESKIEWTDITPAGSVSAEADMLPSSTEDRGRRPQPKGMQTIVEQADTCRSAECNDTASTILNRMDPTVDPCDNFYRFACGGFINSTTLPDDKKYVDEFNTRNKIVAKQLRTMMESEVEPNERKSDGIVKNLYSYCMNMTPLMWDSLDKIDSKIAVFNWALLEGDQYEPRRNPLFYRHIFYATHYVDRYGYNKIHVQQPTLGFRKFLLAGFDDKIVQTYYNHMVDMAVLFGADRNRAEIELEEVLKLDIQIANISLPDNEPQEGDQGQGLQMTMAELVKKYPNVHWQVGFVDTFGRTVRDDETVLVEKPRYISELSKLIASASMRLQSNYGVWRSIEESVYHLNKEARRRVLGSSTETIPRWEVCVARVYSLTDPLPQVMYSRKYLANAEAKKNIENMFENIKQQLINDIQQAGWMDKNTQEHAVKKVSAMEIIKKYDHEAVNDDEEADIVSSKLGSWLKTLSNWVAYLNKNESTELPDLINESPKSEDDVDYAFASYNPYRNFIVIQPGLLRSLYFNNSRPQYVNYGGLGHVLGHEISHGFDGDGRAIDEENERVDWVTPSTEEKFLERTQCIIDQYNNFTDEETGLAINGERSQQENFADNSGLKIAYRAYDTWAKKHEPEPKLPGLNYTSNQMFWITMATTDCTKYKPETLKDIIEIHSSYAPSEYRILGSLSNMPEFSDDFKCPKGSKMNPLKKCKIW